MKINFLILDYKSSNAEKKRSEETNEALAKLVRRRSLFFSFKLLDL